MPGKDGIVAIREIRAPSMGTTLPITGFTADADKPRHEQILQAGANTVLTKPIGETDLLMAILERLSQQSAAEPALVQK